MLLEKTDQYSHFNFQGKNRDSSHSGLAIDINDGSVWCKGSVYDGITLDFRSFGKSISTEGPYGMWQVGAEGDGCRCFLRRTDARWLQWQTWRDTNHLHTRWRSRLFASSAKREPYYYYHSRKKNKYIKKQEKISTCHNHQYSWKNYTHKIYMCK